MFKFIETFVLSINKFLNARCKKWCFWSTHEQLIAPQYLMQISATYLSNDPRSYLDQTSEYCHKSADKAVV